MPAQRAHTDLAALDEQDESVRIAVHALGDMRNSGGRPGSNLYQSSPSSSFQPTPALSITSRSSSPSLPSPSIAAESVREDADNAASSPDLFSRMSTFPLVGSALRAYETGKASSRVVKYGAEMMESSVRSISRPVIERLPVNQLDEFACRQLDRLESYSRRASSRDTSRNDSDSSRDYEYRPEGENRENREAWSSSVEGSSSGALRGRSARQTSPDRWKGKDRDTSIRREDEPSRCAETHSRTPTPRQEQQSEPQQQQQVVQRSRWQAMVLEVGGIGAAFSEESMRRLKYCLQWLQYATAHIDQQILVLRNFIDSLQAHTSGSPSPEHLQTLTAIRRDVVHTIREVVNVVSKYAGGALPEPARGTVRSFILRLPERWQRAGDAPSSNTSNGSAKSDGRAGRSTRNARASAAPYTYGPGEPGPSSRSRPASRATSPSHSRTSGQVAPMQHAAQKILTLAVESLDMLRAVTAVFKESLDKADAWVERLRSVGINRPDVDIPMLPPASTLLSPTSDRSPARSPGSGIAPINLPPPSSNGTSTSASPISPNFPPPSSLLAPPSSSRVGYREPLPPIALSPASTNPPSPSAMSPYQNLTELQLPPLRSGPYTHSRQGSNGSQGHPHTEFGALSLNGSAGSRSLPVSGYATPRSAWPDNEDKDSERGRVWERDWDRERTERDRRWEEERVTGEERKDGRMDVDQ